MRRPGPLGVGFKIYFAFLEDLEDNKTLQKTQRRPSPVRPCNKEKLAVARHSERQEARTHTYEGEKTSSTRQCKALVFPPAWRGGAAARGPPPCDSRPSGQGFCASEMGWRWPSTGHCCTSPANVSEQDRTRHEQERGGRVRFPMCLPAIIPRAARLNRPCCGRPCPPCRG